MTLPSAFRQIRFQDPSKAAAVLEHLTPAAPRGFNRHLAESLHEVSNGDRTLLRLDRVLESADEGTALLTLIAEHKNFSRLMCTVLDQSQFLTDIICREPEALQWVWERSLANDAWRETTVAEELSAFLAPIDGFDNLCDAMRRFNRREVLRIGARDVYLHVSVQDITKDLTDLAEAMLQIALDAATEELRPRYGIPMAGEGPHAGQNADFVIMGMGKLGGRELNFSSDIDLIFIYSDEGTTDSTGSESVSNAQYFAKLGELAIKALSENTTEGHVFRVDMRLRPHGRAGPLSVSLATALEYFQSQGRAWERQALIKARPVAGNVELGIFFVKGTRPFVYPRHFYDETLEDIRDTKRQMEKQVAQRGETEIEVKLGRGGIRDIEFTVQMLQLLNGGRTKSLRTTSTLEAIDALGRHNLLSPFEAQTLTSNYVFLRQIEHRIQIEGSQQRHALPKDPGALDDLARRLGYESGETFMVGYRDRAQETRLILDRFLATEGRGQLWVSELLDPDSEDETGLAKLAEMGFKDCKKARQELLDLHIGTESNAYSAHVRRLFRDIAPRLLQSLSSTPDPDAALLRLGRILSSLKAPSAIYDILKHQASLSDALVTLVANSHFLADLIIRNPGLFETFGNKKALELETTRQQLEEELQLLKTANDSEAALYRLRNAELLRIGMRDVLGHVDVLTVGRELSLLADLCLQEVYTEEVQAAAEHHGCEEIPMAILGLGKLGGRELGYGSDLDIIFVYDGDAETQVAPSEFAATAAARVIKRLKQPTSHGTLYDVDTRLRPDGSKGPLAVSHARLQTYYLEEAQAWERLALMKARVCVGDAAYAEKIERIARHCAYARPLTKTEIEHTEDIRRRIAENAGPLDVKKGEGGIAEMELALRLLQLHYGSDKPELQRTDVEGMLEALAAAGHVTDQEQKSLGNAYLLLRRVENRIRMMQGRGESKLPSDPHDQDDLARRLNVNGDLANLIEDAKAHVHAFYQRTLKNLNPKS